jgi:hypothetical protein
MVYHCDFNNDGVLDKCEMFECIVMTENEWRYEFEHFTFVEDSIVVEITVVDHAFEVFLVGGIIKIDDLVGGVGIPHHEHFDGDIFNIFTSPSTITIFTVEWGGTEEMFKIFRSTIFISPMVFSFDNTLEEFTLVNVSIIVIITRFN